MIQVDAIGLIIAIISFLTTSFLMGWTLRGLHDLDKEERDKRNGAS